MHCVLSERCFLKGCHGPQVIVRLKYHHFSLAKCRGLITLASKYNAPGNEDDKPNIDALAQYLSKEAAKLRSSIGEGSVEEFSRNDASSETMMAPQADELEAQLLAQVGFGGFDSTDFELVQQLGSISMQQAVNSKGTDKRLRTALIAYAARYHPRLPYSQPVITLLKEYLPISRPVACNELLLLRHLCGLPDDKYKMASEPRQPGSAPVVPLLGYFLSCPSDVAADVSTDDSIDSIWLVYKWEGLRPLSLLMQEGPPLAEYGLLKNRERAEKEAWDLRRALLRATASGLLNAVDFCHSADVVHGSISSGSVLLGTWENFKPGVNEDLEVKLDGFGFGRWYSYGEQPLPDPRGKFFASSEISGSRAVLGQQGDDASLISGRVEDLQAAGLLLMEMFMYGLAPGTPKALQDPKDVKASQRQRQLGLVDPGAGGTLDRVSLQRLLFDVFHDDVNQFRDYCLQDSQRYNLLVAFLDEFSGAGWEFFSFLLTGRRSALELAQHPFLKQTHRPPQNVIESNGFKLPWQ
ncbi:hypothetical protein CEUSTIGMA_g172.t1 [Chlamydomonas eustigma]|uniref:Protein kinase domain-containing protein n=1 Tax=Chlamydomonas eustigma TaxID=1157962 RepID=A0A250WPU1_9CHLO|nr:hypothetical protein CEUSTIGMA_g172.t1 [Chlamydomonas eustigma]|eukprot:GAX72716.1 hypothetical protein CEUSTIGMA_g172.t1 [Chlamydomonas eustigma]